MRLLTYPERELLGASVFQNKRDIARIGGLGDPNRALVALVVGRRALEHATLFEWNMSRARYRNWKSKLSGEL